MKTVEFKLNLNQNHQQEIERWLEVLKVVWNRAIAIMEWKQYYDRLQKCLNAPAANEDWGFDIKPVRIECYKSGKDYILYSKITADFRIDKSQGWEIEGNVETRQVLSLVKPHWQGEPKIDGYSAISLRKPFAMKRYPWLKEQNIPSLIVNDYIGLVVAESWKRYQQGKVRRPRYKSRRDRVQTIPSESARAHCKFDWEKNKIKLPGLGWIKLKNLNQRITPGADISTFKICCRPSGYYLQLGWVDAPSRKTRSDRSKTCHLKLSQTHYDDGVVRQEIPVYLAKSLKKLQTQQQKLSRCVVGSNRWHKQKVKVGKIQEKIKAQRNGWQHWHSSKITDIYGDIEIETISKPNPVPKPDPKLNKEKDGYDFNGAERVANSNRFKLDAALSAFKTKIATKGDNITESTNKKKKQNLEKSINKDSANAKTRKSKRSRNKKRKDTQKVLENSLN